MTRTRWILLALAVLLGSLSIYWNTDWFRREDIQISHRFRPPLFGRLRKRPAATPTFAPVFFEFNHKLKLTDVRVVPCSAAETNAHPHPIWHLISNSNSVPTRGIMYGEVVPGMRPEVKGAAADDLEPGVNYRLLIQAGPLKAIHNFVAGDPVR
jgi:hypothetical protein